MTESGRARTADDDEAPVGEHGAPAVGDPAPDFVLQDVHGTPVRLSDYRGRSVLLVFFPFAFSGICTSELRELQGSADDFENTDVDIIAISCDSTFALKAWAAQEGFSFELLSDFWPHGQVSREYGVFDGHDGLALRGTFLIDVDGIVQWRVLNGKGQARDIEQYREAIERL